MPTRTIQTDEQIEEVLRWCVFNPEYRNPPSGTLTDEEMDRLINVEIMNLLYTHTYEVRQKMYKSLRDEAMAIISGTPKEDLAALLQKLR